MSVAENKQKIRKANTCSVKESNLHSYKLSLKKGILKFWAKK